MAAGTDNPSESFFGKIGHTELSRDFEDIEPVDDHGACRIFKARRMGKWFMLKCLKPEYASVEAMCQLLRKEFAIGFRLDHPNVMRTYDIEAVPSLGECIVCEWIDGTSLSDIIAEGRLKPRQAVDLCRAVAEAVGYMHSMQVMHLDLKASNIMVTRIGGQPKIIDFGMSDAADYAVYKTVGGTREYMAPETVPGSADTDPRADIYALGVIIDKVNASLPSPDRALRRIAARCMRRDPQKRYASVADIRWPRPGRMMYVLAAASFAVLAALAVTPWLAGGAPGTPQHVVDTLMQVVEVHDTVEVAPPVDSARLEFLASLEHTIPQIVDQEWNSEFKRLVDRSTHTKEEAIENHRKFYDSFGAKSVERVRRLIDSRIPKDDPDYFKIMSGAVAECQRAVSERSNSDPHNNRVIATMFDDTYPTNESPE